MNLYCHHYYRRFTTRVHFGSLCQWPKTEPNHTQVKVSFFSIFSFSFSHTNFKNLKYSSLCSFTQQRIMHIFRFRAPFVRKSGRKLFSFFVIIHPVRIETENKRIRINFPLISIQNFEQSAKILRFLSIRQELKLSDTPPKKTKMKRNTENENC